jgi:ADP-ribose pyrophosphatase YjhB (NUDIX family)
MTTEIDGPKPILSAKYCLHCGNQMTLRLPPGDNIHRQVCAACGFIHYENPKLLAACILFSEHKVLWVKRAKAPNAGLWAMPGGYVELGETVEEAASRELAEETGVVISPGELSVYGVVSIPAINQIFISLIAPLPSMHFTTTEETLDVKLAGISDISPAEYAYPPGAERWIQLLYDRLRSGNATNMPAIIRTVRSPPG